MTHKKSIKFKSVALLITGSMLMAGNAQARSLLYGMEKQLSLHASQSKVESNFKGDVSNQNFYGTKAAFTVQPKVKGAVVRLSYDLMGSKTLSQGADSLKPTLHNYFVDLGYKTSTRQRMLSTTFLVGVGSLFVEGGNLVVDGKTSNYGTKAVPAAKLGLSLDRKLGRFSPWSHQFEIEGIQLLNNNSLLDNRIYGTSVGVAYRL